MMISEYYQFTRQKSLESKFIQFAEEISFNIKYITKKTATKLFISKCYDLRINASRQQMYRFFELLEQKNLANPRKLDLTDMSLGDSCMVIVAKIIHKN